MSASSSKPKINLRSTAVKRIMQEASELANPQEDDFTAAPLETDIFEWHCTMRGVEGSEYDGGLYHLRIVLPPSYPMSAPDIILMTPNGRFELGKKICIDGLTSFHAGSWQPAWGVRTAILGLRSFWMQGGEALSAIGALDYPKDERKRLAKLSKDWVCPTCGIANRDQIPEKPSSPTSASSTSTAPPVPLTSETTDPTAAPESSNSGSNNMSDETENSGTSSDPLGTTLSLDPFVEPVESPRIRPQIITTPAIPTPTRTSTNTQVPPTTMTTTTRSRRRSSAPVWLDMMIGLGISLLVVLIARRMG